MTTAILLTPEQAAHVRGPSSINAAFVLDPSPLTVGPASYEDRTWFLTTGVLDDPYHAPHHDYLAALPQIPYSEIASLRPEPPPRS